MNARSLMSIRSTSLTSVLFSMMRNNGAMFSKWENIYSRFSNPTTTEFIDNYMEEDRWQQLEWPFYLASLHKPETVVSCRSVWIFTHLLQRVSKWNINHTYVDAKNKRIGNLHKKTQNLIVETSNLVSTLLTLTFLGKLRKTQHTLSGR